MIGARHSGGGARRLPSAHVGVVAAAAERLQGSSTTAAHKDRM